METKLRNKAEKCKAQIFHRNLSTSASSAKNNNSDRENKRNKAKQKEIYLICNNYVYSFAKRMTLGIKMNVIEMSERSTDRVDAVQT